MTLLLDPKCGGNRWPFETFMEFDNAHRYNNGRPAPRLTFSALCVWRTSQLWLHLGPINRANHFLIQGTQANARRATRGVLGVPALCDASHGHNTGACDQGAACRMSRGTSHAPVATPECTPQVPAPTTPAGTPPTPTAPPTTQDNRCPGRWRAFPPDQVAWIES
jgi:hypothetical protein